MRAGWCNWIASVVAFWNYPIVLERIQLNCLHEVSRKIILQPLGEVAWLTYRVLTAVLANSRIKSKFGIRKYPFCAGKKKSLKAQKTPEQNDVIMIFYPNDLSFNFNFCWYPSSFFFPPFWEEEGWGVEGRR